MDNLQQIIDWFDDPSQTIFTIQGSAGTGKTTLTVSVIQTLINTGRILGDRQVLLAAPSHHAKNNLFRTISSASGLNIEARTIASLLRHSPVIDYKERKLYFGGKTPEGLDIVKLIVVDEVSMIGASTIKSLESLGVNILFLGDDKQLPPVGGKSPFEYLDSYGGINLTKVHRQSGDLLRLCNYFRDHAVSDIFRIGTLFNGYEGVKIIAKDEDKSVIQSLEHIDFETHTILSFTNRQVVYNNLEVHGESGDIRPGDYLLAGGNVLDIFGSDPIDAFRSFQCMSQEISKSPFALNGSLVKVVQASDAMELKIEPFRVSDYIPVTLPVLTLKYQEAVLEDEKGGRISCFIPNYAIDNPFESIRKVSVELLSAQLDKGVLTKKDMDFKRWNKSNLDLYSFLGQKLRPKYAMSVHKAQGKTLENVVVDLTLLPSSNTVNWIYTAVSRSSKTLTIVG